MATTQLGRNQTGIHGTTQLLARFGRGVAARDVTVPLPADAQITWSAPGGDDTFTCTVPWPDRGIARPDAFTHNMPVRVEDRRTGEIIWQGRIADPGFSGDRASQEFRVSCVGMGRDLDQMCVLKNYVDRDPGHWFDLHTWPSGPLNSGDGTGFIAESHDSLQIPPDYYLEFPWPANSFQATGAAQIMAYLVGLYATQDMGATDTSSKSTGPAAVVPEVHGLRFSWMTSFANANDVQVRAGSGVAGSTVSLFTTPWTGAGAQNDFSIRDGNTGWTREDFKFFYIQQDRTGGNITSSGGDGYFRVANLCVIGKRYDRYSNDITATAGIEALNPYEIFEDMLGTTLNNIIDPGQIQADHNILIDHASYWTATPVSQILDDANAWNADWWWGVWAAGSANSRPRLDYRTWNTAPRYTLDDSIPVQLAGGSEEWSNSALITYMRGNGVPTTTRGTVTVPTITRVFGGTNLRTMPLDLTSRGPISRTYALQLATQALADSSTDKTSGSAVITGATLDQVTGRLVQPWEMRPGWPVVVESTPNQFTSGATGTTTKYDGESTFRLTKVTYSAADNTATLELDGGGRRLFKAPRAKPQFTYTNWADRAGVRRAHRHH